MTVIQPADAAAVVPAAPLRRRQAEAAPLRVLLVDPSLFTAPYDAALTGGLLAAGVEPHWVTRPTRAGDRQEMPIERTDDFFYRRVDQARGLPAAIKPLAKGIAHLAGLARLCWQVRRERPDLVHFQWAVLPLFDALAFALIRRVCPVVLTVHDTIACNGSKAATLRRLGYDAPARLAQRLIVHTESGRQTLIARGLPAERIRVIPHGALSLPVPLPTPTTRDPRWTVVMFGEIKPYKGLDLLIEAVHQMPAASRAQLRVIVAGRPMMDLAPLQARIGELGLAAQIEIRPQRQSEAAMAALFEAADCFVFPYRQVDASGVYFLVKGLGRWLIASRVGVFAEDLVEGEQGVLLESGDVAALAGALAAAVAQRPCGRAERPSEAWADIGRMTRSLYADAIAERG